MARSWMHGGSRAAVPLAPGTTLTVGRVGFEVLKAEEAP